MKKTPCPKAVVDRRHCGGGGGQRPHVTPDRGPAGPPCRTPRGATTRSGRNNGRVHAGARRAGPDTRPPDTRQRASLQRQKESHLLAAKCL